MINDFQKWCLKSDQTKVFELRLKYIFDMEMSVHSRNLVMYPKRDEQFFDDKNNNVKNDHMSDKTIEKQSTVIENIGYSKFDIQQWDRTSERCQRKYRSDYRHHHTMEKQPNDLQTSDSCASELAATTKSNTVINFSVDSILSNSNQTKNCDSEKVEPLDAAKNLSINRCNATELANFDDLNRIYRPLPMRYLPNPNLFHGNWFTQN